ncbi:hypothetical protein INR75_11270 [Zunongwangia sp. SCSIO 43204]|uniref:hypothetical protein n=1 Tax=Zunongwangia sp. SCSIO 43204 TaxID=2779359 RepID=UPI001CA97442|nr:hypothetical protein [Zunongwangia sp. SCSIO 43204]UAB82815.1 hypothetical protein INR75_11270 [Zunongwangia sp. SCSIO 43204]
MEQNVKKHNILYAKRLAKKLKKEENLNHHEALNRIARQLKFKNWKHFLKENQVNDPLEDSSRIISDELTGLDLNGFSNNEEKFNQTIFSKTKKIDKLRSQIKKYFTKTKSFNLKRSSYGLKHDLERHIDEYVANGELIYAMHLEGYKIKRDGINCYFNISSVGLKNLIISEKVFQYLNISLSSNLQEYLRYNKRFKKYKYHFKLIIKLLLETKIPLMNVCGVIGAEIGETAETIKQWFAIENGSNDLIPKKKLDALSDLFGFESEELKNF